MPALVDVDTAVRDVPDAYTRLVDIMEVPALRGRIKDASLSFLNATVEVYYGPTAPGATQAGDQVVAGSGYDWSDARLGWLIERIWLREAVAAAGARAVFAGVIEVP